MSEIDISPQSKKHSTGSVVSFLLMLSSIAIVNFIIYADWTEGILGVLGYAFGVALFPLLILAVTKPPRRYYIVFLLVAFMIPFGHRKELLLTWQSNQLVSNVKQSSSISEVQENLTNSNNPLGKVIAYLLQASNDSNNEIAKLWSQLEDPEIDQSISKTTLASETKLRKAWNLSGEKANLAAALVPQITSILEQEHNKVQSFLASDKTLDMTDQNDILKGVQDRHTKHLGYYLKKATLSQRALASLRNILGFLVTNFSSFQVDNNGKILFKSESLLSEFNIHMNNLNNVAAEEKKLAEEEANLIKEQSSLDWVNRL